MTRLLVTGCSGQLGRAVTRMATGTFDVHAVDRAALDIRDATVVASTLRQFQPDCVINAAAYTAVDRAESEAEAARAINETGVRHLAENCADVGCRLLHVSTDFVFSGEANVPYPPDAPTGPLGEYGRSKRAGEMALMQACDDAAIVRTAWLYGPGGSNFVRTMLRLLGERPWVSVVCDQIGAPTHVDGLAAALLSLVSVERGTFPRVMHWSDAGVASWFDVAEAVRLLAQRRWPDQTWGDVRPISTAEFPTPAARPRFSVLDTTTLRRIVGGDALSWQARLSRALMNDPAEEWLPPSTPA